MAEHGSTDAATRAAHSIAQMLASHYGAAPPSSTITGIAAIIDRETGLRELFDTLEETIDEAGDLIESRSPELVMRARTALRYSADRTPTAD